MTIAERLRALFAGKADIAAAIAEKGRVAPGKFAEIADAVRNLGYRLAFSVSLDHYSNRVDFTFRSIDGVWSPSVGQSYPNFTMYLSGVIAVTYNGGIDEGDEHGAFLDGERMEAGREYVLTADANLSAYSWTSCLTGDDTVLMADGTERRVDGLRIGDRILSYDPKTFGLSEDRVTFVDNDRVKVADGHDVWTFEDGTVVKTVKRHRLYNLRLQAMAYMDEWRTGDRALGSDGREVALVGHEAVPGETRHFTIFTDHQNYFVNGLLSGNRLTKDMPLGAASASRRAEILEERRVAAEIKRQKGRPEWAV